MYVRNRYLCNNCGRGETIKDSEVIKNRMCSKCGQQTSWGWSGEYDDKDRLVKEYCYSGTIIEHKIPKKSVTYTPPIKPTITCPYCQSTDCKKISGMSRWASTGLFGLASGKLGKQWHCNNCKSDF